MPLLKLENIRKTYLMGRETVRALDDVSLGIAEGDFIAILGPSGSGKSTLMHLLGFLDRPTSGALWLDGRDYGAAGPAQRAAVRGEKIGFVFQAFNLLPRLTVLENVLLPLSYRRTPRRAARAAAEEALAQVGLSERLRHRPSELSGGQRQRVAIARALVNAPRLILADEPTGNLDSHTAAQVLELFAALHRQGRTIILVTHDPKIAAHARRQIHMLDGRVERDVTDGAAPVETGA